MHPSDKDITKQRNAICTMSWLLSKVQNPKMKRVILYESYEAIVNKNYDKAKTFCKIIKKYKLDFLNTAYSDYVFNIFREELIPRIEHKYNYKVNGTINNLPVCTDCKSLAVYRQNTPSVIQCTEYNSMVYALASYLDSNT